MIAWTTDPTKPGHRAAVRLESGRPLVCFPDRDAHRRWMEVWSPTDGHAWATVDYVERDTRPAPAHLVRETLEHYARAYGGHPNNHPNI